MDIKKARKIQRIYDYCRLAVILILIALIIYLIVF